jgi:hypothetical protein
MILSLATIQNAPGPRKPDWACTVQLRSTDVQILLEFFALAE